MPLKLALTALLYPELSELSASLASESEGKSVWMHAGGCDEQVPSAEPFYGDVGRSPSGAYPRSKELSELSASLASEKINYSLM